MKVLILSVAAAAVTSALLAPVPADAQATTPRDNRAKELPYKPEATKEQRDEVDKLRNRRMACAPYPATIAFSVYGNGQRSAGADSIVTYPNVITNEGGRWFPAAFFTNFFLSCPGLYFFTVSFARDAWDTGSPPACAAGPGTANDIAIYLTKNWSPVAWEAWTGEGDGNRSTASYSVTLRLGLNDFIIPYVHSDGGPPRCLAAFHFTGFRIGK